MNGLISSPETPVSLVVSVADYVIANGLSMPRVNRAAMDGFLDAANFKGDRKELWNEVHHELWRRRAELPFRIVAPEGVAQGSDTGPVH